MTPQETVRAALSSNLSESQKQAVKSALPSLSDGGDTVMALMVAGMVKAAADGNVSAFNALMELYGEEVRDAAPAPASFIDELVAEYEEACG